MRRNFARHNNSARHQQKKKEGGKAKSLTFYRIPNGIAVMSEIHGNTNRQRQRNRNVEMVMGSNSKNWTFGMMRSKYRF